MTAKELESEGLRRKVQFSVAQEAFDEACNLFFERKAKTHKVPGFRTGRVPLSMIKKQFLADAFDFAVQELVKKEVSDFLKVKKEVPIQQPSYQVISRPTDAEPQKSLVFEVSYEKQPALPEISYTALELEKAVSEVQDSDIQELISEWMQQSQKSVSIKEKRASRVGDVLRVNVTVQPPEGEPHKMENLSFLLQEKELGSDLFKSLSGVEKGSIVTRKTLIPKNHNDKSVAGKKLPTTYEILDIQERIPCENIEDLPALLGLKDVKDVEAKARDILSQKGKELEFLWLKRQVLDYFVAQYTFDLPQSLVDAEFNKLWQESEQDVLENISESVGKSAALLKKDDEKAFLKAREAAFLSVFNKKEEDVRKFLSDVAKRRVKLGFLLSELGRMLSVSISNDETRDLLLAEMRRYKGREKEVANFYQRTPQALTALKAPLFERKVVEALLVKVPPQSEKVLSLKEMESRLEDQKLFEKVA